MKDDITLLVVLLNKRLFTEMRFPRTWSRCTNMQVSLTFHVFWHIFHQRLTMYLTPVHSGSRDAG